MGRVVRRLFCLYQDIVSGEVDLWGGGSEWTPSPAENAPISFRNLDLLAYHAEPLIVVVHCFLSLPRCSSLLIARLHPPQTTLHLLCMYLSI